MTGFPIIKVISVKGAIPIQSQLSHHLQINLYSYLQGHGILIECICQSPYKTLVLEMMVVVVFFILYLVLFCFCVVPYYSR